MLCARNLIILLIAVATAITARAQSPACAETRLDVKPGAFFLTQPRDQEDHGFESGMCYAAVAAQMFDACRKVKDGRNGETSIVATAIEYTSTRPDDFELKKGGVAPAIAALEKMGSCPTGLFDEREAGIFKTEKMIAESVPVPHCPKKLTPANDLTATAQYGRDLERKAWVQLKMKKQRLINGLNKLCPTSTRLRTTCSVPKAVYWHPTLQAAHELVAQSLREGLPVSLTLGGHMLKTGTANYKDVSNQHAVLVIGSQINRDGGCEYLIRNSYGPDCDGVSPTFKTCDKGQMWIPIETIDAGTASVTYFPSH